MAAGLQILNDPSGVMDHAQFNQQYPALSLKVAIDTAKRSGLDPADPRNVVQTMQSNTYQKRIQGIQNGEEDASQINIGKSQTPVSRRFTQAVDPASEISGGYQDQADAIAAGKARRSVLSAELMQESDRLSRMVDFDKEAYTNAELARMRPTESIDKAIMDIRNRALIDKASFFSDPEINALPFDMQSRVIAERMGMYTEQINDLSDLRKARLEGAKATIKGKTDAYSQRVEGSKTRITALEKAIDLAKEDGADDVEIAQLRIDHAKEVERLNKARDKGGGQNTGEELVANALIQRYQSQYGVLPEGADLEDIRRQSKLIVKNNKGLTEDVVAAGGQYDRVPSRGTPGLRTVGGDPFAEAGFSSGLSGTARGRIENLQDIPLDRLKTKAGLRQSVSEGYLMEEDLPVTYRR